MKTCAAAISLLLALFPLDVSAGKATPKRRTTASRKTPKKTARRRGKTKPQAKRKKKAAARRKARTKAKGRAKTRTKRARARKRAKRKVAAKAKKRPKTRATPKTTIKISKKQKAKAKKFFAQGKKLFRRKKYAKAVEAFEKAYLLWKHKVIEYNLALAYAFKGDKVTAGIYVRKYLKKAKGRERNLVPVLQQVLEDTGVLVVRTVDPKAAILVDGRLVGHGNAEVVVVVGKRAVDIAVNDRVVARRVVNMPPDGRKVWELFEVPSAPLPIKPGIRPTRRVRVATSPGPVPTVPSPAPTPPRPSVWSKMRRLHWAYFASAGGVAAAALGAAVGMWVTIRKMDEDCRKAPCTNSEENKGFTYQKTTNALWGVAGGAALAAGVLVMFTRWRTPEKQVSVLPAVGPGTVGLTVSFQR